MTAPAAPSASFWQRRLLEPLRAQLTQGVTPDRLAFTVAVLTVGVTLAFRFVAKNPELFASNLDESNLPPPPTPRKRP